VIAASAEATTTGADPDLPPAEAIVVTAVSTGTLTPGAFTAPDSILGGYHNHPISPPASIAYPVGLKGEQHRLQSSFAFTIASAPVTLTAFNELVHQIVRRVAHRRPPG
jgi:hypothetical protein